MSVLGIIIARGGSKQLPRKNLAMLEGRSLLGHAIDHGRGAKGIDRLIVSTEDPEIAQHARECGAEVPFIRPDNLSTDEAVVEDVVVHAIQWLKEHEGYEPPVFVLLQPTSPLRTSEDIDACVEMLLSNDTDAVVSVTSPHTHPRWMFRLNEQGRMQSVLNESVPSDRSGLSPVYALNGAVYAMRTREFMETRDWFSQKTLAYVMPPERSLDINAFWELEAARALLKMRQPTPMPSPSNPPDLLQGVDDNHKTSEFSALPPVRSATAQQSLSERSSVE